MVLRLAPRLSRLFRADDPPASGDPDFALPYWDWTQQPRIPDGLFDSALTPTDAAFAPYTKTLETFTSYFKPGFEAYWGGLAPAQRQQLAARGYTQLGDAWNDVTGNGEPGNEAFAVTSGARYLSRANPNLDAGATTAVSKNTVLAGLLAPRFNDPIASLSFTSSKSASHTAPPAQRPAFSVLEGQPHNLVHNCIGGVGPLDPGPYGNMTNFLSPVDPVFFLHHANMDRLWDVWVRKQQSLKEPFLPEGQDLKALSEEPFLFFVDAQGKAVLNGKAGDYLSMDRFNYEYDRAGYGEELIGSALATPVAAAAPPATAQATGNAASLTLPAEALRRPGPGGAASRPVVALITLDRGAVRSDVRQFRVLLGAGDSASGDATVAGTIGFFGPPMAHMHGSHHGSQEATFAIALPPASPVLADRATANAAPANVTVRLVPAGGGTDVPGLLKSVAIGPL